jgi:hypothetical protein
LTALRTRFLCSVESRSHDEQIFATASLVARWVLLEHPAPWATPTVSEANFPRLSEALEKWVRDSGVRLVLIRRGSFQRGARPRAFLVSSAPEHRWIHPLGINEAADLVDIDIAQAEREAELVAAAGGKEQFASTYLVCTHGRHDVCCAVEGNPVYRALRHAFPREVWQCSHIGGDRFAANVVALPQGVYFGRLTPETAVTVLQRFREGHLVLPYYRGKSFLQWPVQAAEFFVREELSLTGVEGVDLTHSEVVSKEPRIDRVRFSLSDGRSVAATVVRTKAAETFRLTCRGENFGTPTVYQLYDLEVSDGG